MAYTVSQNTTIYTTASVLQKAVSFVYFTIVARTIGVESTGQYFFALSFAVIFTVLADFGLAQTLTREASRYPEKTEDYVITIFWTKVLFGLVSYLLMVGATYALGYDAFLRTLILVAGITMFFDNLHNVFFGVFRAHRTLMVESIGIVLSQVVTMAVGVTALINGWPLWWLIAAYSFASVTTAIYAAGCLAKYYSIRYRFTFNPTVFKSFLAIAVPFGVAGILMRLYSYADSIIMSKMLDAEHLGWWSVPYKMSFAFQFIPVALSASIFPVMSALSITNKEKIGELFDKAWRYLLLIAFPLAFGLGAVAGPLIIGIYGASYAPSVPVLRVLLISLVFGYLSFVTGATLNATNNQKKQTVLLAITLVCNVALNFALIPVIGLVGAAIAALIGNMMLSIGGYFMVRRFITINMRSLWVYGSQVFWSAAVMGVVAWYLAEFVSVWLAIPVGALVYGVLLFVTGAMTKEVAKELRLKIFPQKRL